MSDRPRTGPERISALEQWARDHDARCEERIGELRDIIKSWRKAMYAVALGLMAWAASQLYANLHDHPPAPSPVAAALSR